MTLKDLILKTIKSVLFIAVVVIGTLLISPLYIRFSAAKDIYFNAVDVPSTPTCLVLGASVRGSKPSPMLEDRLTAAFHLYARGKVEQILLSGDHSSDYYNEVKAMKQYLLGKGVNSDDILLDRKGFSTYHSVTRAKELFQIDSMTIVTQEYHLPRAIYLAEKMGIESNGMAAEDINYPGMDQFKFREYWAQIKAFIEGFVKPDIELNSPETKNANIVDTQESES